VAREAVCSGGPDAQPTNRKTAQINER